MRTGFSFPSRFWLKYFLINLILLSAGLFVYPGTALPGETKQLTATWEYPDQVPELSGFSLYHNGASLCETQNPAAREIDCSVYLEVESNAFTLTAFTTTGSESDPSEPFLYTYTPTPANTPPQAIDIQFSTQEDHAIQNVLTGSDPDNDPLIYSIVSNGSAGSAELLNASTGEFQYSPNADTYGTDTFTYHVSDGVTESGLATVSITVVPVNDPPVAQADSAATDEGIPITVSVLANDSDIDGDTLSINTVQQAGHGSTVLSGSNIVYTPAPGFFGTDSFQYEITDGIATVSETVTVVVNKVNHPPTAFDTTVILSEDTTYQGLLHAYDQDNDALTYAIISPPASGSVELISIDNGDFRYQPNTNVNGSDSFSYTVSDGLATATPATVFISVQPANDSPTANAGPDQTVHEGSQVVINAANSFDPDGDSLTFFWSQLEGPAVTLSDQNSMQPTFTAPDVGADNACLLFQITVTDPDSLVSYDTCIVNITWINDPPVADAGNDQTVYEGELVTLNGANSYDSDDGIAVITWAQTGGPLVNLSDPTIAFPTFTAPESGIDGVALEFTLTVEDNSGLQAQDSVIVNVVWINDPPVADAGDDQTVHEGDIVSLDGTGSSDPDDGIATIHWTQLSGTPVTLSDPTAVWPTFSAPTILDGDYNLLQFQVTATDFGGLQSSDTCLVTAMQTAGPLPGDLNNDGVIDKDDYKIMKKATGKCQGNKNYLPAADLNGDGCVTWTDYDLLRFYDQQQ
jgi:hypothetical protein